jgi:hypothetical protein
MIPPYSDVALLTSDGHTVHAHKGVLAMASDVWAGAFEADDSIGLNKPMRLDASKHQVDVAIQLLYSGATGICSDQMEFCNALPFMHKYDLWRPLELAVRSVREWLKLEAGLDDVLRWAEMAERLQFDELLRICADALYRVVDADASVTMLLRVIKTLPQPSDVTGRVISKLLHRCVWDMSAVHRIVTDEDALRSLNPLSMEELGRRVYVSSRDIRTYSYCRSPQHTAMTDNMLLSLLNMEEPCWLRYPCKTDVLVAYWSILFGYRGCQTSVQEGRTALLEALMSKPTAVDAMVDAVAQLDVEQILETLKCSDVMPSIPPPIVTAIGVRLTGPLPPFAPESGRDILAETLCFCSRGWKGHPALEAALAAQVLQASDETVAYLLAPLRGYHAQYCGWEDSEVVVGAMAERTSRGLGPDAMAQLRAHRPGAWERHPTVAAALII